MNWILGKLVDLINWMADREESKSRKQDVPAPKTPPGASRRLPDGYFAARPVYIIATPDRPIDPYMEQVRQEARALTGKAEAARYPKGS